ncbi:MAG: hypothetical protein WC101_04940 [Candidatus Gracilibacteria bacterium]
MPEQKNAPAPAPTPKPDSSPKAPLTSNTIEGVITDAAKEIGKKPDELLNKLRKLKSKMMKEKLKVTLDTAEEIQHLKALVQESLLQKESYKERQKKPKEAVDKDYDQELIDVGLHGDKFIGELVRSIDNVARREQAEDEINKLPGVKDVLGGVEKVEDLRKLDAKALIALEDKYEGILLYAFTDVVGDKKKLDFKNWSAYSKPAPGTRLQVNFRGNSDAETLLGGADLLPPSVRRVTVYANGDEEDARTSERRLGLKGRNRAGNGFFDKKGYIPIYSGDVIEIGGRERKKDDTGIDKDFEMKFRKKNPDGSMGPLDEEAYAKFDEERKDDSDKAWLEKKLKDNPNAQRGKQITPEEVQALIGNIEASGASKKVVEAALAEVERGKTINKRSEKRCCGEIVRGVYKAAKMKTRCIYMDINYDGIDCGTHHAGPEMMKNIKPGDWLFYNNKNPNWKGLHSAIVLKYDYETGDAVVASGYVGHPMKIHTTNLKKNPVTRIAKPVEA